MPLEGVGKMRRTEGSHRIGARILEVGILIALPILFHYLIPVKIVIAKPYSYLGAVLMLLGLALMAWAAMLFRKVGTSLQLRGGGPFCPLARLDREPGGDYVKCQASIQSGVH
jgi:hypothetical protein